MASRLFSRIFIDPSRENRLGWAATASSVVALTFFGAIIGVKVPSLPDNFGTATAVALAIFGLVALSITLEMVAHALKAKLVLRCVTLVLLYLVLVFVFGPALDYFSGNYFAVRGALFGWIISYLVFSLDDVWSDPEVES